MKRGALTARLIQLAFLTILFGAWHFATVTGSVSKLFLPQPSAVWAAFSRLVVTGQFWSAVKVTLLTTGQAYMFAIIAGVLVGYLVSRSRFITDVFEPIIAGLFTIPITLFFPMFILFFGIGTGSKIAYGATYAFFPIALTTIAAFNSVEPHFINAARSMGASRWSTFRHVLVPRTLPVLINGLRIAFVICFASVLGGETLSSIAGVGRNIALAAELLDTARMYAWIAFVVLTAVTLNLLATSFEQNAAVRGGGQ